MFSAIVPKNSKNIRKSPSFHDFVSEMLLRKCFSGHVKSSFDNPTKNFPVKKQVFLVKFHKKMKNQMFKSIFSKSLLSTLRLLFRHTWIFFFAKIRNKLTQSPKRDVNSTNYFHHFFLKVLLRTREMHFEEPWQKFFAIRRLLSLRYRKRSNNYSLVFSPEKP